MKAKGGAGGLELAKTGNETCTCPLTVVQSPSYNSKGIPATILSPARISIIIKLNQLIMEFWPNNQQLSACVPIPSLWKMEEESQTVKVTAEKELEEDDGPFMIHEYGDYYKLVYCDLEGYRASL